MLKLKTAPKHPALMLALTLLLYAAGCICLGFVSLYFSAGDHGLDLFTWYLTQPKVLVLNLLPFILLGLLLSAFMEASYTLVYVGIACFGLSLVFQLITLPVEFNASRRAMQAIESVNILTDEEQKGARKTLTAAALTYVAATAVALSQLLRLLVIFGGRRRRD